MKPQTKVWILCESIGKPDDTLKLNCTVREAIRAQAEWLLRVYMGTRIRVTIAREESELESNRRSAAKDDILADLDLALGDINESKSDCPICEGLNTSCPAGCERETLCSDPNCRNKEPHIQATRGCIWNGING